MEAVLDVYEQAEQEDVARICFDEMPYQMVDDVLTPLPMRSGATAKQDYEYERKGCSCVLLAYDLDRGVRYTEVREHRRKADYAEFMDHLIKTHYSDKRKVLWVQDNLNTHTYGALYENLPVARAQALRKQVAFHFTPKHGSWLNIAECEFSVLVRQCLDRRLPSIDRVRQEVNAWQNERNAHATKVRWTFTTSQAQSKMARHYAALNQSPVTSDAYFLRK